MQPLPSLGQRRIAKQVRGELLCRGGQRPAALVDEGELAHRIETSNRHDTNLPSSGNGQLADEGKTTGGLYHAQHRGYGSKLHHHIHLDAQVAQCAVDDLTDGAAAFETDVVLAGEGLHAQLPVQAQLHPDKKGGQDSKNNAFLSHTQAHRGGSIFNANPGSVFSANQHRGTHIQLDNALEADANNLSAPRTTRMHSASRAPTLLSEIG